MKPLLPDVENATYPHAAVLMTKDEPFTFLWQAFLHDVMIYVLTDNTMP